MQILKASMFSCGPWSPSEGRNAHHTWMPVPCKCSICARIVWMLLMIFFWWPTSVIPKLITSLKKTNAFFISYFNKNLFGAELSSTLYWHNLCLLGKQILFSCSWVLRSGSCNGSDGRLASTFSIVETKEKLSCQGELFLNWSEIVHKKLSRS